MLFHSFDSLISKFEGHSDEFGFYSSDRSYFVGLWEETNLKTEKDTGLIC